MSSIRPPAATEYAKHALAHPTYNRESLSLGYILRKVHMRSSLAVTIGLIALWLPPATFAQTQMPTPQPPQVVALAPQALSLEHGNVADVAFDG
jgi:hypothetical protein